MILSLCNVQFGAWKRVKSNLGHSENHLTIKYVLCVVCIIDILQCAVYVICIVRCWKLLLIYNFTNA